MITQDIILLFYKNSNKSGIKMTYCFKHIKNEQLFPKAVQLIATIKHFKLNKRRKYEIKIN